MFTLPRMKQFPISRKKEHLDETGVRLLGSVVQHCLYLDYSLDYHLETIQRLTKLYGKISIENLECGKYLLRCKGLTDHYGCIPHDLFYDVVGALWEFIGIHVENYSNRKFILEHLKAGFEVFQYHPGCTVCNT